MHTRTTKPITTKKQQQGKQPINPQRPGLFRHLRSISEPKHRMSRSNASSHILRRHLSPNTYTHHTSKVCCSTGTLGRRNSAGFCVFGRTLSYSQWYPSHLSLHPKVTLVLTDTSAPNPKTTNKNRPGHPMPLKLQPTHASSLSVTVCECGMCQNRHSILGWVWLLGRSLVWLPL